MMGGGGAMRAAAKVAGIGAMAGGIRGAESPVTFATRKMVRPASASVVSSSTGPEPTGALKVDQTVQRPVWEIDDWDFAGGEDDFVVNRVDLDKPRVVFGSVPTLDEAKEATYELKDALEKVYLSSPKSSGSVDSFSSRQETKACVTYESSVSKSTMQAFRLLKESPAAQNVVASIACDPNVWNAVMQNPSLAEFLESEKHGDESSNFFEGSSDAEENGKPDGFKGFVEDMKQTVMDKINGLLNLVQSFFGVPEVEKQSKSCDGIPRSATFPGGTFMGLAIMVIMVTLMKRG